MKIVRRYSNYLFALACLLLMAWPAAAQKDSTHVKSNEKKTETARVGTLVVVSDPPGAAIFVGDRRRGETRAKARSAITLAPGRYQLRLEYPDYESFQQEITINAGEQTFITAPLQPGYGFIKLTELAPDAAVILDDRKLARGELETLADGARIRTARGPHRLKITRAGYRELSQPLEVAGGATLTLPAAMERLRGTLVVQARAGARVYIDDHEEGTVPGSGRLALAATPDEPHRLLVENDGYKKYEMPFQVRAGEETPLAITLVPLPTSAEFFDNFESGLKFWQAPAEWSTEGGHLRVHGSTRPGVLRDKWYCDGEIVFGLRLLSGRGAAWVVRAQNDKDFYLFCITGPEAGRPNRFLTYLCRGGNLDLSSPLISPLAVAPALRVGETYRIRIHMQGNVIEHFITPSSVGEESNLAVFEDSGRTFSCGDFGFIAPAGEDFLIDAPVIRPPGKKQ